MIRLTVLEAGVPTRLQIDIESDLIQDSVDRQVAQPLLRCALATVLAALAIGEAWPDKVLVALAQLLGEMKGQVIQQRLH